MEIEIDDAGCEEDIDVSTLLVFVTDVDVMVPTVTILVEPLLPIEDEPVLLVTEML